ncbi:unnamed protein product [Rotaria magnacalcarata]
MLIVIYDEASTNRRISSSTIKAELQSELNITISESTTKRRAHEAGFYGRAARKKPYINRLNLTKRLEYARTYREKPLVFWNDVIWPDESKFNLFRSVGKIMTWRTPEEFNIQCAVPTVKDGGGSVMYWGCFSSSEADNLVFIDKNMTGEVY